MNTIANLFGRLCACVRKSGQAGMTALPKVSYEQAQGMVCVGADSKRVEDLLGEPQIVTKRDQFEVRNYLLSPSTQNRVELLSGIYREDRLVRTRHLVLQGAH